jgi:hypothetical protein
MAARGSAQLLNLVQEYGVRPHGLALILLAP